MEDGAGSHVAADLLLKKGAAARWDHLRPYFAATPKRPITATLPHLPRRRCACLFLVLTTHDRLVYLDFAERGASKDSVSIASRMRWLMNHADFWVIPRSRASWCELRPFLPAEYSQIAGNHLESGIGESSKIVPFLTLNCLRQSLQRQSDRVAMCPTFSEPQNGQITPFGQRKPARKSRHTASSSKYLIAARKCGGEPIRTHKVSVLPNERCIKCLRSSAISSVPTVQIAFGLGP
jgi:hypothetical protein